MNVVIQKLATPPTNPVSGQIYFNTASERLFYYNGKEWVGADALDAMMTGESIVFAINGSTSIINLDNLPQEVKDAVLKAHNTHEISDVTGLQNALDGKVDNSRVLKDVPADAVFTDTKTIINGKTGVISKADIVALGIPAQDTTYSKFDSTSDGLVPKSDGSSTKYLRADGIWVTPPDTKYTLPVAGVNLGGVKTGGDVTIDSNGVIFVKDDSHNHVIENIDGLQSALDSKETPAGATAKASIAENNAKSYTDTKIAELIGSAPEALDTLHELAQALGSDPNFATTITNTLAQKTNKFTQAIGDGTNTSFLLTHNLNSRDVVVMIRESASPYAQVITDVEMTTVNTITVKFAQPPATNEYTVTIIG